MTLNICHVLRYALHPALSLHFSSLITLKVTMGARRIFLRGEQIMDVPQRVHWSARGCLLAAPTRIFCKIQSIILITGKCEVPKVKNGTLRSGFNVGSFVNHGNVLDYRCDDGFTNQTAKPHCYNGTWTTTPLCVPGQHGTRSVPP